MGETAFTALQVLQFNPHDYPAQSPISLFGKGAIIAARSALSTQDEPQIFANERGLVLNQRKFAVTL